MTARAHEWIDFGLDVREVTDLCIVRATTIAIHATGNQADIEIETYGRVNNVPIFYHCQEDTDTDEGWAAFEDDMPVLAIRYKHRRDQNISYAVISPAEGLIECTRGHLYLCFGGNERVIKFQYAEGSGVFAVDQELTTPEGNALIREILPAWNGETDLLAGNFPVTLEPGMAISSPTADASIVKAWRYHYSSQRIMERMSVPFTMNSYLSDDRIVPAPIDLLPPWADVEMTGEEAAPGRCWFKTCDDVTVAACVEPPPEGGSNQTWGIAATFRGLPLLFPDGQRFSGGSLRSALGLEYFMGFDVWQDGADYFISTADQNGWVFAWKVNQTERTLTLTVEKTVYDHVGGETDWSDTVVIVGLDKTTAYYMRPNLHYYWKFQGNTLYQVAEGAKDEMQIKRILWDHMRREPVVWKASALEFRELDPKVYASRKLAYTYYSLAYCSVYEDGHVVGDGCDGAEFMGSTTSTVDFERHGVTMTLAYFVGQAGWYVNTTPYDIIKADEASMTTYPVNYVGDGLTIGGGGRETNTGGIDYIDVLGGGNIQSGLSVPGVSVCYTSGVSLVDLAMIMDPENGISGNYSTREEESIIDPDAPPEVLGHNRICVWKDETEDKTFGDAQLSSLAGDYPYDGNWIAILLEGKDCAGRAIEAPAIAYAGGIIKTGSRKLTDAKYNQSQIFWQKYRTMEECT